MADEFPQDGPRDINPWAGIAAAEALKKQGAQRDAAQQEQRQKDHGIRAAGLPQPSPTERLQNAQLVPEERARVTNPSPQGRNYTQIYGDRAREKVAQQREQTRAEDRAIATGAKPTPAQDITILKNKNRDSGPSR